MFNNGVIYSITNQRNVLNTTVFDNLKLSNAVNMTDTINNLKIKEMNFFELASYLRTNRDIKNFSALLIELHKKISIPTIAFVFALIGLPLAVTPPRARTNRGFLFSIIIIFVYYLLNAFFTSMGEANILTPVLAAWLPNIILAGLGGIMFYKKAYMI